jgi:phosphoglycolate phosphatase-like HAD superfamily hydrolase
VGAKHHLGRDGPKILDALAELENFMSKHDKEAFAMVSDHEKDFLSAYQAHMKSVYKELAQLSKMIDGNSEKVKKDVVVSKLEQQLAFFKQEFTLLVDTHQKLKEKFKPFQDRVTIAE